jgi:hypothetical protein
MEKDKPSQSLIQGASFLPLELEDRPFQKRQQQRYCYYCSSPFHQVLAPISAVGAAGEIGASDAAGDAKNATLAEAEAEQN